MSSCDGRYCNADLWCKVAGGEGGGKEEKGRWGEGEGEPAGDDEEGEGGGGRGWGRGKGVREGVRAPVRPFDQKKVGKV